MVTAATRRFEESLVAGTPFADRFVVDRVLGRGGMGVVFAARHLELDELVAVKVMLPEIAANAETAARFFREARASVRIKSDYVVRILDVARLHDDTPYMVMEYLDGVDLDTLIDQRGPVPLPIAARYIIEAADAIAAAHAIGIVHRDLKPQNLFLARHGDDSQRIKVLDFGISKLSAPLSHLDASLTQTSSVMGSPLYMSPEQMQSAKTVDQRSDIWSLGCVLFELVTGRPPFNAPTIPELCAAVFTGSTPVASRVRPDLPKSFNAVVARCLEKSPELRYATVAQLARDLLPFAPEADALVAGINRRRSSMPPPSNTPIANFAPTRSAVAVTAGSWEQPTGLHEHRKLPARRRLVGISLALAVVAGAFLWSHRHGTDTAPPGALSASLLVASSPNPRGTIADLEPKVANSRSVQPLLDARTHGAQTGPNSNDTARATAVNKSRTAATPRVAAIVSSATKTPLDIASASATTNASAARAPSLKIDIK